MKTSGQQSRKQIPLKVWLPILIAIIVVASSGAWYFIAMPFSEKQQQIRAQDTKAKQLYADHQACVEKLNQDFKELDDSNQTAYQKAYDHCEEMRKEQNKAVDQYKQLVAE